MCASRCAGVKRSRARCQRSLRPRYSPKILWMRVEMTSAAKTAAMMAMTIAAMTTSSKRRKATNSGAPFVASCARHSAATRHPPLAGFACGGLA
jgi:hypothetical protein